MDSNGLVGPLDALPPEIISIIISHLPLDDRKNVRLTCQMLSSCCNSRSIREKEKFVFRMNNYTDDIVRILENSESVSLINLEFQDMETKYTISPDFWKLCGSRVRSVEFYCCFLDKLTLRGMLRYCVNLTSIAICNKQHHISDFFVVRVINDLNANKITYPKLLKFVYEPDDPLDVKTVSRIFSIFPNIQLFSGNFCCSGREMLEPSQVPSQLCRLTWNLRNWSDYNKTGFCHIPLLRPVQHLRLTKYEEHIPFDLVLVSNESQKAMLNFFTLQTNLQSVSLTSSSCHVGKTFEPSPFDKKVIFHILRSCPHLRELIFECNGKVRLNINEAKEFLTLITKLRVLVLKNPFGFEKFELSSLPISLALDTLCIKSDRRRNSRDRFLEYLFRHTRNLQRLGLTHPTDSLLQIIFNTMPHLQTLILRDLRDCTEEGFFCLDSADNRHFFLSKMQRLEYLDLSFGWIEDEMMVERIIREIKLPCLKHLRLQETRDEIPLGALRIALSSISLLNSLDIGYVDQESLEKIANLCEGLKKLRNLTIRGSTLYPGYLKNLLERCPTLRFVRDKVNYVVFTRNSSHKFGWMKELSVSGFRLNEERNLSDWLK